MSDLQNLISESTKTAMKAREKERVKVLRMVNAEFKRVEVDERRELTDRELAVRLAYFLWSAPPDQQLLDLAQRIGRLAVSCELFQCAVPEPIDQPPLLDQMCGPYLVVRNGFDAFGKAGLGFPVVEPRSEVSVQ